ncbi:MFS transporter [Fulvivirga lutimaris]|uniref:MFS transporter n=1 Tax=Fulvivirga lutimaris TaxID=1819566 RepID=UPI0012BCC9A5|nr:MFS transporter [Fulvivirga lutimaris]MTI38931.1 MFS transporter [Fulvivirga lutimaris]
MIKKLRQYISTPKHMAVGLCFLLLSVLFALWITRIPEVKLRLGLSEGDLGSVLFFTPLGAIISMLLSSNLIRWKGEGKSTVIALLFYGVTMATPLFAYDFLTLCIALFLVGFSMGWVDISMNAVANTIEKVDGVKIMSTSHGFFSLGGIIGGSIGGILAGIGTDGLIQMIAAFITLAIIVMLIIAPKIKSITDDSNKEQHVIFSIPGKSLMGLAVIAFCIMLGEGAIADWSTVYLNNNLSSGPALAGFGFAAFSATMTIGRFNGDYLIEKFGSNNVVKGGLIMAFAGLILLFIKSIALALLGFGMIGFGYSSVIPILFSQASQKADVSPARGLASVATLGYFGFLLGPVIIGWTAEIIGLAFSFGILAALTLVAFMVVIRKTAV